MLFAGRCAIIIDMEIQIGKTREEDAAAVAEMYAEGSAALRAAGVDNGRTAIPHSRTCWKISERESPIS